MSRSRRVALALLLLAAPAVSACASAGGNPTASTRTRADRITAEEIAGGQWANALDLVERLRPRWLQARQPATFDVRAVPVRVRIDDAPYGPASALRDLTLLGVTSLEWVDPTEAAARWGPEYASGAIVVRRK